MTPAEKAEELKEKFDGYICYAEVAVDELIRIAPWGGDSEVVEEDGSKEFYINVKKELNKL